MLRPGSCPSSTLGRRSHQIRQTQRTFVCCSHTVARGRGLLLDFGLLLDLKLPQTCCCFSAAESGWELIRFYRCWCCYQLCYQSASLSIPLSICDKYSVGKVSLHRFSMSTEFYSLNLPFPKLRSLTQTGQLERSICHMTIVGQLHGCAPWKLMQSFQIFFILRLVLWILSSSWLNVVSGALLKVMFVIRRGSKEIYVLYLSKIKRWKVQHYFWAKLFRCPHSPLNPSQFKSASKSDQLS